VASQGEVLVSRRKLGFASPGTSERFIVMQASAFSSLETVLVVPIDEKLALYDNDPLVVAIPPQELGSKLVALPSFLTAVSLRRFEAKPVGDVSAKTLLEIHRRIEMLLALGR
jgi:mRNA-degrading endonuclease toxin of MazEF toxin-antitoxin module